MLSEQTSRLERSILNRQTGENDMTLSSSEVDKRMPVWEALSELFVGKELQEYDYQYIADTLSQSGYSMDVLETILRNEVTPVFRENIGVFSIPEMEGWNRETIKAVILDHLNKPQRFLQMIWFWRQRHVRQPPIIVQDRWHNVKHLLS